jgi:hypothetical protein
MPESYRPYRVVLLAIAGIVSVIVSAFGLFVGLWEVWRSSVTEFGFWFIPSLSVPVFLLSFKFRRVALLCSYLIPLGTFVALFVGNLHGRGAGFADLNLSSVVFDLMIRGYKVWITMLIMPICLYVVWLLSPPQSEAAA